MSCAELLNTQAYIDGEAKGPEAEAAERHIEGCAECRALCVDVAALSDGVRVAAVRHRAPLALRLRVAEAVETEDARQAAIRMDVEEKTKRAGRRGFWRGAFGGVGMSGLVAALTLLLVRPPSPVLIADEVTDAHTRALMEGRAIAVVSSDHHTVKPWFAGRIALSPPVTDFAAEGFKLTGGRLDRVAGQPAAVVVYAHGRHVIDLFVWADRSRDLPATSVSHGYHAMFWKRHDLDFAAVSDTQAPELATFADLVRAQPE